MALAKRTERTNLPVDSPVRAVILRWSCECLIKDFGGRLVKEMGDGILAVFESSSDAVFCANAIQHKAAEHGLRLRIALHQSEVVLCGGDVHGDGVNLTAHLEPLANPGEVLATDAIIRDIQNKEAVQIRFIGEPYIKHSKDRWKVYEVVVDQAFLEGLRDAHRPVSWSRVAGVSMKWALPVLVLGTTGGAVGTINGAVAADVSQVLLGIFFLFYTLLSLVYVARGFSSRSLLW